MPIDLYLLFLSGASLLFGGGVGVYAHWQSDSRRRSLLIRLAIKLLIMSIVCGALSRSVTSVF
jgi:hypothetical protein